MGTLFHRFSWIVVFLCMVISCSEQSDPLKSTTTMYVRGVVADKNSKPVADALVSIETRFKKRFAKTTTNANGRFAVKITQKPKTGVIVVKVPRGTSTKGSNHQDFFAIVEKDKLDRVVLLSELSSDLYLEATKHRQLKKAKKIVYPKHQVPTYSVRPAHIGFYGSGQTLKDAQKQMKVLDPGDKSFSLNKTQTYGALSDGLAQTLERFENEFIPNFKNLPTENDVSRESLLGIVQEIQQHLNSQEKNLQFLHAKPGKSKITTQVQTWQNRCRKSFEDVGDLVQLVQKTLDELEFYVANSNVEKVGDASREELKSFFTESVTSLRNRFSEFDTHLSHRNDSSERLLTKCQKYLYTLHYPLADQTLFENGQHIFQYFSEHEILASLLMSVENSVFTKNNVLPQVDYNLKHRSKLLKTSLPDNVFIDMRQGMTWYAVTEPPDYQHTSFVDVELFPGEVVKVATKNYWTDEYTGLELDNLNVPNAWSFHDTFGSIGHNNVEKASQKLQYLNLKTKDHNFSIPSTLDWKTLVCDWDLDEEFETIYDWFTTKVPKGFPAEYLSLKNVRGSETGPNKQDPDSNTPNAFGIWLNDEKEVSRIKDFPTEYRDTTINGVSGLIVLSRGYYYPFADLNTGHINQFCYRSVKNATQFIFKGVQHKAIPCQSAVRQFADFGLLKVNEMVYKKSESAPIMGMPLAVVLASPNPHTNAFWVKPEDFSAPDRSHCFE